MIVANAEADARHERDELDRIKREASAKFAAQKR